jgi:release factor glutamine methyltransferase
MGLQIKEILAVGENILAQNGIDDYKRDAEILLCHEIHYDAKKVFMNWARELDDEYCEAFFAAIQHRAEGVPTQYITGTQSFMGLDFTVTQDVLIPRMDTETLVETVSEHIKGNNNAQRVLDLCTGSGAIAVSLAKVFPSLRVTASDISAGALKVAAKNAAKHGVSRIKFVESDLFESMKTGMVSGGKFDVIVSNPPYIRSLVLPTLQREIFDYEPLLALDGGADGLDFYRRIIEKAPAYLRKNGALFLEIGYDQATEVTVLLEASGRFKQIEIKKDLTEADRVISALLSK